MSMGESTGAHISTSVQRRAEQLFTEECDQVHARRDRVFFWLLLAQWAFAIGLAILVSPYTWAGSRSSIHAHIYAAVFLGGAINLPAFLLIRLKPGHVLTRHVVAVSQMLWSALLIHLTGGRIETHFHIFGSLAFLAFYRDWRLLVTATLMVALDHLLRGVYWPESVYGIVNPEWWRFLEHAFWVAFEDLVLAMSIHDAIREMRQLALRQAQLERVNEVIEATVEERTRELRVAHRKMNEFSRKAGMAEVATGILHNVGNTLNSVNVSAGVVTERVRQTRLVNLHKVTDLLRDHSQDLGDFLTQDPKGKQVPQYLAAVTEHLEREQQDNLGELQHLVKRVYHIKAIVALQQDHAKTSGVIEEMTLGEVIDDALKIQADSFRLSGIEVIRRGGAGPRFGSDAHRVLQILVNLLGNARHALAASPKLDKRLFIEVVTDGARIKLVVQDNGVGIVAENMRRIFTQGFSTKKDGHGFGLHMSAITAKALGGSLSVASEGSERGATFTLDLPLEAEAPPLDATG
jgi:signal transduction histidine kinase